MLLKSINKHNIYMSLIFYIKEVFSMFGPNDLNLITIICYSLMSLEIFFKAVAFFRNHVEIKITFK